MEMVVLNESGLTEENVNTLKKHGNVTLYSDSNNSNYKERIANADIAVADVFLVKINKDFLAASPNLKFISINSTGFDNISTEALQETKLTISNVPAFSTDAVAELSIALMFLTARKLVPLENLMRKKVFVIDPGTELAEKFMGFNLKDKTLGIIGLGDIGTRVAEMANGLGMSVIGYNRTPKKIGGVEFVDMETLLKQSDIVSLNLALNSDTKDIISKRELSLMKPSALIINTASGGLIKNDDLVEALKTNQISGVGLDGFIPYVDNNPLLKLDNVVVTPHIGYLTQEASDNMGNIITENILAYLNGKPINTIP